MTPDEGCASGPASTADIETNDEVEAPPITVEIRYDHHTGIPDGISDTHGVLVFGDHPDEGPVWTLHYTQRGEHRTYVTIADLTDVNHAYADALAWFDMQ